MADPNERRMVSSNIPNANVIDQQAHIDAKTNRGGFAGAILDLVGSANDVISANTKMSEQDRLILEKNFGLNADSDTKDYASYGQTYISKKAQEEGVNVEDFSREDLDKFIPEMKKSYMESKGLDKKKYREIIDKRLNDKDPFIVEAQDSYNRKTRDDKNIKSLHDSVADNFKRMDSKDLVDYINSTIDMHVGPDAAIQRSVEEVKSSLISPLMTVAIETKDPELLKKIKDPELKALMNIPDYDNVVDVIEQQVRSTINKKKSINFDTTEEQAFLYLESGAMKSKEEVDSFLEQQQYQKGYEPDSRDMLKLRESLYKAVKTESGYSEYYAATKSGDYTYAERNAISKKDREALENKFAKVELGIQDTSPQGLIEAIKSSTKDDEFKQYARSGYPWSPDIINMFNSDVSGDVQSLKDKANAYTQLVSLTQDTPNPITAVLSPKTQGNLRYLTNLTERLDNGLIDNVTFQDAYTTFTNDLNKNVDSYGMYSSVKSKDIVRDESVQKWANDFSKDAPWTWDENTNQSYIKRNLLGNFNILLDSGMEPNEAKKEAEKMFENSHQRIENPDGSETALPQEFKTQLPESIFEVAYNLPELKSMREANKFFGSEFLFKRKVSVRPHADYENNKLISVYYDGKKVGNTDMDREKFDTLWNTLETQESKRIKKEYEERIKKQNSEAPRDKTWDFRTN